MQGIERVSIVMPENPTALEEYASREFARYAGELTGVECDICSAPRAIGKGDSVVSIGETALLARVRSTEHLPGIPKAMGASCDGGRGACAEGRADASGAGAGAGGARAEKPDASGEGAVRAARNPGSCGGGDWTSAGTSLNTSDLGREGFLQKSVAVDGGNVLFLAGGSDIGTLYSVCDYFERFCDVGYFVDGDHVPDGGSLRFSGIDNVEKPRFANRFWNSDMGHFSHMRCQTALWQFPEWKKQIDWMVKRKLNLTLFFVSFEFTGTVARKVFGTVQRDEERYYVGYPATWAYPDAYREELAKDILGYARQFGIRFIYSLIYGAVPAEFKERHPELEYISDDYQVAFLKPDDPVAREYALKFSRELIDTFGTDHLYMNTPFCETNMGGTPEKDLEIKILAATRTAEVMRELDPEAVWVTDAWDFYATRANWTEQSIARYLDSLPKDMMLIYETAFDLWDKFYQKKAGYYRGMRWAIGVLNSFSSQDSLHGDIPSLDRKIREVLSDPGADKCDGLFMVPELTNQNVMFWQIVTKYAWDPLKVDIYGFLDEYTLCRYGRQSYPVMREVIQIVYETFYMKRAWMKNTELKMYYACSSALPNSFTYAASQAPLDANDPFASHLFKYDNSRDWRKTSESTRRAIELALGERDNQKDNPLYENDMVVLDRMYLGSMTCACIDDAYTAFRAGNVEAIECAARDALAYLSRLELLLSRRPDYSLGHMIDYVMAVKGVNSFTPKMIKNACTAGVDYNGNDIYEQIRFYYKPRLARYFDILKEKASRGDTVYERDEMDCGDIIADWSDRSLVVPESEKYQGTVLEFIAGEGLC